MTLQYLDGLPHIDFRVFMEPLEDIVLTASNKLEREIYRRLETNESLQGLLLGMVREGKL